MDWRKLIFLKKKGIVIIVSWRSWFYPWSGRAGFLPYLPNALLLSLHLKKYLQSNPEIIFARSAEADLIELPQNFIRIDIYKEIPHKESIHEEI